MKVKVKFSKFLIFIEVFFDINKELNFLNDLSKNTEYNSGIKFLLIN